MIDFMFDNRITVVTAYFDIGRGQYKKYNRTSHKYIDFFGFWAGIQNDIVVYTQAEYSKKILKIRKDLGLENKTIVIEINPNEINQELYSSFCEMMSKSKQNWRCTRKILPEIVSGQYCYITNMKSFVVVDAIKRNLIKTNNIIWIDFGFNHGGDVFLDSSQMRFNLEFKKNYDNNKLVIYQIEQDDNRTMAQVYYDMIVFYIGGLMYGSKHAWIKYNQQIESSIYKYLTLNMIDDDQLYMVDAVRNHPDDYQIENCSVWFDSLIDFIPTSHAKLLKLSSRCKVSLLDVIKQRLPNYNIFVRSIFNVLIKVFAKKLKKIKTNIIKNEIFKKF